MTSTPTSPSPISPAAGTDRPDITTPDRPESTRADRLPAGTADRRRLWAVGINLVLLIGLLVMVAPFVWMILGSIKTTAELRQFPPTWWPEEATTGNYRDLLDRLAFPRYFLNSAVVAVAVTAGQLLTSSMLAYALAKLELPGKRLVMAATLATLMVPPFVTFMPQFVLVSRLGLVNTYGGLIVPFLAGAFGVFLLRQFMISGIPDDLLDAARVDGAGEYRIFFRIVLPLCGPALATVGVLTFLSNWNSFLWPLVVSTSDDHYTLPVAVALFSIGQQESDLGLQLAGSSLVILPVIAVFLLMQRAIVRGIATTGMR